MAFEHIRGVDLGRQGVTAGGSCPLGLEDAALTGFERRDVAERYGRAVEFKMRGDGEAFGQMF